MPRVPYFVEALDKIKKIHEAKNNDYAVSDNPFSNFDFTEQVMEIFKHGRDKTFIWPIATKIARLSTLLNSGNRPQNESIEDSFLDIATYILLWRCDYIRRNERRISRESHPEQDPQ